MYYYLSSLIRNGGKTMGALIIWLVIMIPVSSLLTGLGIFAWRRQKPMWFWSGQTVGEEEIVDVKSYNRANGVMWIGFSLFMWVSTFLAFSSMKLAGIVMFIVCILCVPVLPFVYSRIYKKYSK